MMASQTGATRSRRRSLLATSVPPERFRTFSTPRAGYPILPVQLHHMVMGMCSFQIGVHLRLRSCAISHGLSRSRASCRQPPDCNFPVHRSDRVPDGRHAM
jgi:hypothetical protein